ncbi:LexA family protein [Muricomes intestini]|jgi:repressor LexA|uniref:LexA family protein n=1 Tax=Muricomes intestini TaxID=1796634 RepID=UPI002FDE31BE
METIGDRIKRKRKEMGMSADKLAEILGVSRSTIFRYENGDIEKVPASVLMDIACALNTTSHYLMGWEEELEKQSAAPDNIYPIGVKKYPLLGEIACGEPIFCNEDRESYVISGADINADFCLKAHGDSMINARILDGDIVFIREQSMVDNGEIAAVIIDDEATLKRIYYDGKTFTLIAENPKYQPMVFSGEKLNHVRILGKAIAFQSDVI